MDQDSECSNIKAILDKKIQIADNLISLIEENKRNTLTVAPRFLKLIKMPELESQLLESQQQQATACTLQADRELQLKAVHQQHLQYYIATVDLLVAMDKKKSRLKGYNQRLLQLMYKSCRNKSALPAWIRGKYAKELEELAHSHDTLVSDPTDSPVSRQPEPGTSADYKSASPDRLGVGSASTSKAKQA